MPGWADRKLLLHFLHFHHPWRSYPVGAWMLGQFLRHAKMTFTPPVAFEQDVGILGMCNHHGNQDTVVGHKIKPHCSISNAVL